MARIRSVKPDFFRHEGLYNAEQASRLPLRVAFAGLWTAADREGRFRWAPKQLKLDCLPYDEVDFSRVLDALATCGFIVKYASDGKEYGFIPSWHQHQVINNREKASDLPDPSNSNDLTRDTRVNDASGTPLNTAQVEGKGREVEGKGREGESRARGFSTIGEDFELTEADIGTAHDAGMTDATIDTERKLFIARKQSDGKQSANWSAEWRVWCERWKGLKKPNEAVPEPPGGDKLTHEAAVKQFAKTGIWSRHAPCGEPGQSTCNVPAELFEKYGLLPDGRKIEQRTH